jgi:uncharacterized protein (TIGR02145 family)
MKNLLPLFLMLVILPASAQNYLVSFSGTGLSSVKVENLISGLVVNINSGDVLHLSSTTAIPEVFDLKAPGLKIYPNPTLDKTTLEIHAPVLGNTTISVYDITGKLLTYINGYMNNSMQQFILTGTKSGIYLITVQGKGYQYTGRLFSSGKTNGKAIVLRLSNDTQLTTENKSINNTKGSFSTIDMAYNTGERLKYTATSGNNSTVVTDIPTEDKTVIFTFLECKDGDNNYYPIVLIGTQIWMAENLKTTNYNDVTSIPLVTDNNAWINLTTPGYCWYNNDAATYKVNYGAIYNFFTVNTGKLCPTGWHVPTNDEWSILTDYLGGESVAGGKLKETGTAHWNNPNTGATNEIGFTAIPGGFRSDFDGSFDLVGNSGYWWSSSEYSSNTLFWYRRMYYSQIYVYRNYFYKQVGLSVRCLKDN